MEGKLFRSTVTPSVIKFFITSSSKISIPREGFNIFPALEIGKMFFLFVELFCFYDESMTTYFLISFIENLLLYFSGIMLEIYYVPILFMEYYCIGCISWKNLNISFPSIVKFKQKLLKENIKYIWVPFTISTSNIIDFVLKNQRPPFPQSSNINKAADI